VTFDAILHYVPELDAYAIEIPVLQLWTAADDFGDAIEQTREFILMLGTKHCSCTDLKVTVTRAGKKKLTVKIQNDACIPTLIRKIWMSEIE
jgi:hypothetical protein